MMKNTIISSILFFLVLSMISCSILRPKKTIDDPLLDFYSEEPASDTKASLRLTEKAREQLHARKKELAINTLNQALTIDPQNPFAYYFLALIAQDQPTRSNGFLDKAKQLFIDMPFWNAKSYELSGQNWEKLGKSKIADKQFKKAKSIYPDL